MRRRNETLPCLVCGEQLFQSMPGNPDPSEGVRCTTTGNYGSTVFDPFDGERLRFNICDPCLVRAGETGRVVTGHTSRSVVYEDHNGEQWAVGYLPLKDPEDTPWNAGLGRTWLPALRIGTDELHEPPEHVVLTIDDTIKKYLQDEDRT